MKPLVLAEEDLPGTRTISDTCRRDGDGKVIDTLITVPVGKVQVMMIFNPDEFITDRDSATADRVPSLGDAPATKNTLVEKRKMN